MSQENVAMVHELSEAVARGDAERLIELTDPEVEWQSFVAHLGEEGGVYRGHEGIRRYVSDMHDALDVVQLHVDDTFAVGAVVLVAGRLEVRGRGSGVENEMSAGYMAKFRDGRVVLLRAFRDPEQAFEAVGLRK